MLLQISM